MAFGIVYTKNKLFGPVEVDNRGISLTLEYFMTVPGPDSRFFDYLDIDYDGIRAWQDPKYKIWYLYIDTLEKALEVKESIEQRGGLA